jgi:hypothetical protein
MYVKIGDELHGGEPSVGEAAGDCKRFPAAVRVALKKVRGGRKLNNRDPM